jgi:uncharacterized protein
MCHNHKGWIDKLTCILLVIGGLNWGLVGAFDWNLVNALFGSWMWLERLVYVLVGLAALHSLIACGKGAKGGCGMGSASKSGGAPPSEG